jgi:phytoene dehydrogenase-like protein
VLRHRNTTLKGFLDSTMTDPVLKAILSIQAGDHGVGPARCPLITHALVAAHYFNGGYYPKGGGRSLPRAFVRTLKRHGGEIKLRTRVDRILVEGRGPWRRAVGVRLEDGTEISATTVISNADPHVTYTRMLDQSEVSGRMRKRLARTEYSATGLSLFFAADIDAEAAGLDSSNIWYSQTPSIDSSYTFCERDDLSSDISLPASFLTVTTCKDRSKRSDSIHTMESFTVVGYDAFRKWAHTRFGERPQDYADLKEHLTDAMFANLERFVPGLRERVVFSELGTPLTAEYYAAATRGNFYGTAKTANQIGPWAYPIQTEIRGLLMCGASTLSHGIAGATLSGVHAAAKALGCWPSEVLHGQGQLTLRPCEPEVAGLIESAA